MPNIGEGTKSNVGVVNTRNDPLVSRIVIIIVRPVPSTLVLGIIIFLGMRVNNILLLFT